jgi:hypothetical protein
MNKLILFLLIAFPLSVLCQKYSKSDLVGEWRIVKLEVYEDNFPPLKTAYLMEISGQTDTIVEGLDLGEKDEIANQMVKSMIGSSLKFSDNDFFSWDVRTDELALYDKFWKIENDTILVNEWADKESGDYMLVGFKVLNIDNGKLYLDANDSGGGLKFELIKKE